MPRKTRKSTAANKSDVKRNKENNKDLNNLSLPVLSDEKISPCDKSQKTKTSKEVKFPKILIPQVRLTCLPLNIEKVIDLTTSNKGEQENVKKKSTKKKGTKKKEKNIKTCQFLKPIEVKYAKKLRPRFKDEEEYRYLYNSPSSNINVGSGQKKIKIYIKESKFILRKDSVPFKDNQKEELKSDLSLEGNTNGCLQQRNIKIVEELNVALENKINGANFDLKSGRKSLIDEEPELKEPGSTKSQGSSEVQPKQTLMKPAVVCPEEKSNSCLENKCNNPNEMRHTSLQAAMDSFINNTQLENLKDTAALKKGLCLMWMSNNYKCTSELCPYHHNASVLFSKKFKQYPSRHIMSVLLAMKNDALFVDAVLAAFKIFSDRKAPTIWVTFLVYFVFYVTEPSDSRFFKLWASAARFFCQLGQDFGAAKGFASLLSIFSLGDKSEEWKIIEFIKFIKQSPIQIQTTYDLLQPVLKMNLPSQFLVEAVEYSIITETDILEVYFLIIPKISIMTSPIPVIELLLKFCNFLNQENLVIGLKQKIKEKVKTFKIKVFHREYPLTAAFQEEVLSNSDTECNLVDTFTCNVLLDKQISLRKNNYFQPGEDFYSVIECNPWKPPGDFNKPDEKPEETFFSKKEEVNKCDRQVTRVKQFFMDCHFDVLGKYLNTLKPEVVEQTAQEFLRALLQMKISLQQVLDLMKIILFQCLSETAAKVNASVCVTLIFNLVRINEWEKAHTILSLCEEKKINLAEGKVYYFNEFSIISQLRVLLLILEIYIYKENFQTALNIVKTQNIYSSNASLWKVSWKDNDEVIRVRILEEFLAQTVSKQLTNISYELFMLVWIDQNSLHGPIDLGKFTNEMLILLLNQNVEEGVKFFEKIKGKVNLEETATRAILITLVGQNNLEEARNMFRAINQTTYILPEVTSTGATVTMSSTWLEGEIYVMLDTLFDLLTSDMNAALKSYENFEVNIHVVKPKPTTSSVRPLCLGLINASLEHACKRIERVLQNQFKPPIKLIILPYSLLLDKPSLQLYLERRLRRPPV